MTETLQLSNTNNTSNLPLVASAAEVEIKQLKEAALMDKESVSLRERKELPLDMRVALTLFQERTGTNYFPELLPQEELSNEEIAKALAMHKASVDKLSRPFSVYKRTLDKTPLRRLGWLWKKRIPLGGLTLLNGAHGTCKTLLLLQIAADVSTGRDLLDSTPTRQSGVVIVAPYANAATLLHPLLAALGADLSRIKIISYIHDPAPEPYTGGFHSFTLPEDFSSLSHAIEQVDARLVIMDDFMSLLSYEQRWTNERLRRLLTDLNQRMIERDVACILVRNCPARGSHTRPSLLERSDHFEAIAQSSLLLAPDPVYPDRLLLSHADSSAFPLAPTLTLQIQPISDDSDFVCLTLLGFHELNADDLLSHRPDTLRRQLLYDDLLSFINRTPAPIPVTTLYARFLPASPFQIHRSLKDLLNTEQIERPSRGLYTPLTLNGESANVLNETAHLPPTNDPNVEHLTTVATPPTNDIGLIEDANLLPKKAANEISAIPSHPQPVNDLAEGAAIPSTEESPLHLTGTATTTPVEEVKPNLTEAVTATPVEEAKPNLTEAVTATPVEEAKPNLTETATATSVEEAPLNLTGTATTTPVEEAKPNLTETATTTPTAEAVPNLTETATTPPIEEAPPNLTQGAATTPTEEVPPDLTEATTTIPVEEVPLNLTQVTTTTPVEEAPPNLTVTATTIPTESSTNGFQDIAEVLLDPAFVARFRKIARTLYNSPISQEIHSIATMFNGPHLANDIMQLQQFSPPTSNHVFVNRPQDMAEVLLDLAFAARIKELLAPVPRSMYVHTIRYIHSIISDPLFRQEFKKLLQSSPPQR